MHNKRRIASATLATAGFLGATPVASADTPPIEINVDETIGDDVPVTEEVQAPIELTGETTTVAPTTAPPTTVAPVVTAPTTAPPTTVAPVVTAPTTAPPTTAPPTTAPPTTAPPTTAPPTTAPPTTAPPTTAPPTTAPPTTAPPTTAPPTTVAPIDEPPIFDPLPAPAPKPAAADRIAPPAPAAPAAPAPEAAPTPAATPPPAADPGPQTGPNTGGPSLTGQRNNANVLEVAMATTRQLESGNDYGANAPGSSASGAYQVIDSTWGGYGGYPTAASAPPAIQDRFAHQEFSRILNQFNGDYSAIPVIWYYPKAMGNPAIMDAVPAPGAGNRLTVREYQTKWLSIFNQKLAEGGFDYSHPQGSGGENGITATNWDGVYADGVSLNALMIAMRDVASTGDYTSAPTVPVLDEATGEPVLDEATGEPVPEIPIAESGAYAIADETWANYGDVERAAFADEQTQDDFIYPMIVGAAKTHGGDFAAITAELLGPDATLEEVEAFSIAYQAALNSGTAPYIPTADTDPLIPSIAFPVAGTVKFSNGWHDARDGGRRLHVGVDMLGVEGQPLLSAFDGTITKIEFSDSGTAGVSITVTRPSDDMRANYFHNNDNTPGTNDGAADPALRIHPDMYVGAEVQAGQIIAYMGDTGNAPGVPHVHFEIRFADGTPVNAYPAVLEAQQRQQGTVALGPWSTVYEAPADTPEIVADLDNDLDGDLSDMTDGELRAIAVALAELPEPELEAIEADLSEADAALITANTPPEPYVVEGPDGGQWSIDIEGNVTAVAESARITPDRAGVDFKFRALDEAGNLIPDIVYGSDAAGQSVGNLPSDFFPEAETNESAAQDDITTRAFTVRAAD